MISRPQLHGHGKPPCVVPFPAVDDAALDDLLDLFVEAICDDLERFPDDPDCADPRGGPTVTRDRYDAARSYP